MKITITDCNNIDNGEISIVENTLNLKYGINGTGKSTIVQALRLGGAGGEETLEQLIPYKYRKTAAGHAPSVHIEGSLGKIAVFDEKYMEAYVFQEEELMKGSFEILVKTENYKKQLENIERIVKGVAGLFRDDEELKGLINDFGELIKGFGNAKSGYAASGAIAKGIGKGNKIDNIPPGLESYAPYLRCQNNFEWLEWCLGGMQYRGIDATCPFCTRPVGPVLEKLDKMDSTYDTKELKNFNKMMDVFHRLARYFSESTQAKLDEILKTPDAISDAQKSYLVEIRKEASGLVALLISLQNLSFETLKDEIDVAARMKALRIDLELFHHFQSQTLREKTDSLNKSLDAVLSAATELKDAVEGQRKLLNMTVKEKQDPINEFLATSGYPYTVSLEEQADKKYRLMLHPAGMKDVVVSDAKGHLSYGERNALALALFMFSAISENADFVVLDDPISSFDGNKKFALVDLLFLGNRENSLKGRTVLMLTHDFAPVIDVMKTFYYRWQEISPVAYFLINKRGRLTEAAIEPKDIMCSVQLMKELVKAEVPTLIRLIYLRRVLEIVGPRNSLSYHLISSLLHKRQRPTLGPRKKDSEMSDPDKKLAEAEVGQFIPGFDYDAEYAKVIDRAGLVAMYRKATSYEKLQIFRLIFKKGEVGLDDIVNKFMNEAYHIENDYLFQLDPRRYDMVPPFVIERLDAIVNKYDVA